MADKKTFFRQEDMKTCFLGKKAYAESLPPLSCANFVKRAASHVHPIYNFSKFVICKNLNHTLCHAFLCEGPSWQ